MIQIQDLNGALHADADVAAKHEGEKIVAADAVLLVCIPRCAISRAALVNVLFVTKMPLETA